MVVGNTHVGATVEWNARDRLLWELEPANTVYENRLAVGFAGEPDDRARASRALGALRPRAERLDVLSLCSYARREWRWCVRSGRYGHIVGDDEDSKPKLAVELVQQTRIPSAVVESSSPVGSSASSSTGELASATQIAARCCSPPET